MTDPKPAKKKATKPTQGIPAIAPKAAETREQIVEKIFERIAKGESLVSICNQSGMPNRRTVTRWITDVPEIKTAYELALQMKAEMYAEELVTLADNVGAPLLVDGVPLMRDGQPVMVVSNEAIAHAKLMVNTRQWIVSRLLPKKYGDRIDVTTKTDPEDPLVKLLQAVQGTSLPINSGVTIDHDDID